MTESGTTLLIGILCFVAGAIIGALIHRFTQSEATKNRRLVQQLDQLKEQHTRYQAEVSDHFAKTAELFSKLNGNYRDLLSHLANSSERLSEDVEFKRALNLTGPAFRHPGMPPFDEQPDDFEPPRDYAPKAKPNEKGTLAEDYGMDPHTKL